MEERESMVFYKSMLDAILILKDEKLQNECFFAFINYGLYGEEPAEDASEMVKVVFKLMQTAMNKAKKRYDMAVENGKKGAEFGKLGGAPIGNQNARKKCKELKLPSEVILNNETQINNNTNEKNNPQTTPNVNVNLNDSDNENLNNNVNVNFNSNACETVNLCDDEDIGDYKNQNNETLSNSLEHIVIVFKNAFPEKPLTITKHTEINKINLDSLDINLFIKKIQESSFLMEKNHLGFEWCLLNYDKIVMGYYDDYIKINKPVQSNKNYAVQGDMQILPKDKKINNKDFCEKNGICYVDENYCLEKDGFSVLYG